MFNEQQREIREVCKEYGIPRLADILCKATTTLGHRGKVSIKDSMPYADRGYHGDGTGKPVPPLIQPVQDGAVVSITNQAWGDSGMSGENGFALDVDGAARFNSLWATRWATVDSTGVTADGYYYSDGYEAGTSQGDDVGIEPIRVFHNSQASLPGVGDTVGYIRDKNGLAVNVTGGGGLPNGENLNDMLYWNGTAWIILAAPSTSGTWGLVVIDGVLQWVEYVTFECPAEPA